MYTDKDRRIARNRSKAWKQLGFNFNSIGSLNKRHSLNCGCSMCKYNTYLKKYSHKQNRVNKRIELRQISKEELSENRSNAYDYVV